MCQTQVLVLNKRAEYNFQAGEVKLFSFSLFLENFLKFHPEANMKMLGNLKTLRNEENFNTEKDKSAGS